MYSTTSYGLPVRQDRCGMTGIRSTCVRPGYSDADTWGQGLAMATAGYCLDAPSALPRGSTSGAVLSQCVGGTGPQFRAFVTRQTTAVTICDDRT
jgi:hypothetical protein